MRLYKLLPTAALAAAATSLGGCETLGIGGKDATYAVDGPVIKTESVRRQLGGGIKADTANAAYSSGPIPPK